jgi:hypothetical protein
LHFPLPLIPRKVAKFEQIFVGRRVFCLSQSKQPGVGWPSANRF